MTDDVILTRTQATFAYWQIVGQYDQSGPPPSQVWFDTMAKLSPAKAEIDAVYAAKAAAIAAQTVGQG